MFPWLPGVGRCYHALLRGAGVSRSSPVIPDKSPPRGRVASACQNGHIGDGRSPDSPGPRRGGPSRPIVFGIGRDQVPPSLRRLNGPSADPSSVQEASCHPWGGTCLTTAHGLSRCDVSGSCALWRILLCVMSNGWNTVPSDVAVVWSNSFTRHCMQKLARTRDHRLDATGTCSSMTVGSASRQP